MAPITRSDVVQVHGRYLILDHDSNGGDGFSPTRFFLKGMEFPDAPHTQSSNRDRRAQHVQYNAAGWIAILHQLRDAMDESVLNTLRLYTLDDPTIVDYSAFFETAAQLGFYLMVPLTATFGDAILNRAKVAPHCYTQELWEYGTHMLHMSMQHPNVVAGIIGNEVMNSLESWNAAPCLKAYARDLKKYMASLQQQRRTAQGNNVPNIFVNRTNSKGMLRPIPLLYAAQDSGIGAALTHIDTLRLTVDYLSCQPPAPAPAAGTTTTSTSSSSASLGASFGHNDSHDMTSSMLMTMMADLQDDYSVDIVGVNFEAWCSSYNTFAYNVDGTPGSLFQLWQGLHHNVRMPLVFSELGCGHDRYDRDSPEIRTTQGTRLWNEVPVVLGDLTDTWSGYCAYAYWGNSLFNMMDGGPWNGVDVLTPNQDFVNFREQATLAAKNVTMLLKNNKENFMGDIQGMSGTLHDLPMQNGGIMEAYYQRLAEHPNVPPSCEEVQDVLQKACSLELYNVQDMPSFSERTTWWGWKPVLFALGAAASMIIYTHYRPRGRKVYQEIPDHQEMK